MISNGRAWLWCWLLFIIDLSWNNCGLVGGRALLDCLEHNRTMVSLELTGNSVAEDVMSAVSKGNTDPSLVQVMKSSSASPQAVLLCPATTRLLSVWYNLFWSIVHNIYRIYVYGADMHIYSFGTVYMTVRIWPCFVPLCVLTSYFLHLLTWSTWCICTIDCIWEASNFVSDVATDSQKNPT